MCYWFFNKDISNLQTLKYRLRNYHITYIPIEFNKKKRIWGLSLPFSLKLKLITVVYKLPPVFALLIMFGIAIKIHQIRRGSQFIDVSTYLRSSSIYKAIAAQQPYKFTLQNRIHILVA
jgi:hypothetical protein